VYIYLSRHALCPCNIRCVCIHCMQDADRTYICCSGMLRTSIVSHRVVAEWFTKSTCNPLSGICYPGGLSCLAPALDSPMPPAGVNWGAGSICPHDAKGKASASSESVVSDSGDKAATLADDGRASIAFDGLSADGNVWRAKAGMPQWLQFEFVSLGDSGFRLPEGSNRVRVAGYGITARPGATNVEEEAHHAALGLYDSPMDWQLLGSLDGVEWQVLHTMRAVKDWSENEEKFYEVPPFTSSSAEPPAMRFYRLNVTDVLGRPDGRKLLAISELKLYAPSPAVVRAKVSILFNDADEPTRDLEIFYYRPLSFHDFHPKAGNINGGTEIHVYGNGFIDHPDLRCRFETLYTPAIYVSPTEIVCPAPEIYVTAPRLSLTLNGKDFSYCTSGRCADTKRCSWDCDGGSKLVRDPGTGRDFCAKEDDSCFYERFDDMGCLDEVPWDFFTYYSYPIVQGDEIFHRICVAFSQHTDVTRTCMQNTHTHTHAHTHTQNSARANCWSR
jgi:hypothetical protein